MLKLLGKIRRRLLAQKKLSNYLLYAIGEILLIVIGILIALTISNWNESSKSVQKELVLLTEMQQNLQHDISQLDATLRANKKRIRSNEVVIRSIDLKRPFDDSLAFHFGNCFGNFQLVENVSAWENLKSVGLDLISNDSLRNAIAQLYSTSYVYLESVEKTADDQFQWSQLYPQILKHINIDTLWVSGTPDNYADLLNDREFKEVIKMNIFLANFMQGQYRSIQKNISFVLAGVGQQIEYLSH